MGDAGPPSSPSLLLCVSGLQTMDEEIVVGDSVHVSLCTLLLVVVFGACSLCVVVLQICLVCVRVVCH